MKGLITHTITIGDSLQKLSRLYNINNWRLIAELNELQAPYIDSVFQSGEYKDNKYVAKIGDTILIPTSRAYQVANTTEQIEIEAEAYGRDLSLYNYEPVEHIVKGSISSNSPDIERVEGSANLAQQLMSRLSVKKGALLMHPEYGSNLHRYEAKNYAQENINKIIFETERCIRSDFRVSDITDIRAEIIDSVICIYANIIPIKPGKPFEFKYYVKDR